MKRLAWLFLILFFTGCVTAHVPNKDFDDFQKHREKFQPISKGELDIAYDGAFTYLYEKQNEIIERLNEI